MMLTPGQKEWLRVYALMLWKNWRKRGNRFRRPFSIENFTIAWRMAGCAKIIVDGPPYKLPRGMRL